MKTKYHDVWYVNDGMERPKLKQAERIIHDTSQGRINCVFYVMTSQILSTLTMRDNKNEIVFGLLRILGFSE